jgi:uncharacterized protein (DUF58 family)
VTIGRRQALLWGPFFIFLVAFILHINQMFIMFAALGLLGPISYLLGRRKLGGIEVARHGKSVMTAGELGQVTLKVRNEGQTRQFYMAVRDSLPEGLESPDAGEVLVADLAPGGEQRLQYSLHARRRGVYQVGPTVLEGWDFLGLYRFSRTVGRQVELLVYPRPLPVPNLWRSSLHGRTPNKPRKRIVGPSSDFHGVRDYAPGDDLRRVAWKVSARRGKLAVIETEQTEATEAVVIVDLAAATHRGQGDRSTVEYAATLAASVTAEALGRGCNVGLIAHGSEDWSVLVSSNPRQQLAILEALARIRPDGTKSLSEALPLHEAELPPGCSVIVISAGTSPEHAALAGRLRALQHPVTWLALAPHTFASAPRDARLHFAEHLAFLASQGTRVVQVTGDNPVETSLWRGGAGRYAQTTG